MNALTQLCNLIVSPSYWPCLMCSYVHMCVHACVCLWSGPDASLFACTALIIQFPSSSHSLWLMSLHILNCFPISEVSDYYADWWNWLKHNTHWTGWFVFTSTSCNGVSLLYKAILILLSLDLWTELCIPSTYLCMCLRNSVLLHFHL